MITKRQQEALDLIRTATRPWLLSELGRCLGISRQAATLIVKRLERRGLVLRGEQRRSLRAVG